ncbi:protein kinase domain-containing protein [Ramlibacter albus]|uniref:histidine kinase n=1 Tax=Ramlibacter albus TaxID=2079448 RepID=A0A923S3P9_9BURK|nr:ATP-binding protein [Ramlibacter albus]MBC5766789.1 protein kinase [Ramlibacter albus]
MTVALPGSRSEQPVEVLYESPTTLVYRTLAAAGGIVCKEPLGTEAGPRLERETDMLRRLAGVPGIVKPAAGTWRAGLLALQDCAGVPLAQRLRGQPLPVAECLRIAHQLARTLAEVHRAGIIHRDINPDNILIAATGDVVLIDFDLAVPSDRQLPGLHGGALVGTLGYLAPEQSGRTGRAVDQRSDLYALGATLYEMATGRLPFDADDALALVHGHLVREPEPPSQVDARAPAGLSNIVLRLLAKAPEHRYESLEQRVLARTRELEQAQAQLVATARRAGKAEIANNVLHNVGNVLNSVNVCASAVRHAVYGTRARGLGRVVALLDANSHDIPRFMGSDPRGVSLRAYLTELHAMLCTERVTTLGDIDRLRRSVDHIKQIVAAQQSNAGPSTVLETTLVHEVLDESVRMCAGTLEACAVTVVREYGQLPPGRIDRQRLLDVLVNLVANAAQAMEGVPQPRRLVLGAQLLPGEEGQQLSITVADNGVGIPPGNLTLIFAHGFTTRDDGHGFGLHSSANAAVEMGGRLSAHSDGPGCGATFTLEVPLLPLTAVAPA